MDKLNLPGEEMRAAFEMDQGCAWGLPENRREEGLWAKAWRLATNRAEDRIVTAEHQRALLAEALSDCLRASGHYVEDMDFTGPQLLMFAGELKEFLQQLRKRKPDFYTLTTSPKGSIITVEEHEAELNHSEAYGLTHLMSKRRACYFDAPVNVNRPPDGWLCWAGSTDPEDESFDEDIRRAMFSASEPLAYPHRKPVWF